MMITANPPVIRAAVTPAGSEPVNDPSLRGAGALLDSAMAVAGGAAGGGSSVTVAGLGTAARQAAEAADIIAKAAPASPYQDLVFAARLARSGSDLLQQAAEALHVLEDVEHAAQVRVGLTRERVDIVQRAVVN